MTFTIRYDRVALAELMELRGADRATITKQVREQLAEKPTIVTRRMKEIVRASGERIWQLSVGDYRILYSIDDVNRTVEIMAIGHRMDVYREL